MSRKNFINQIEAVLEPLTNQSIVENLLGKEKKVTALAAETTLSVDFSEKSFQSIAVGSDNVTLNAVVTGMKDGEEVILKIIQAATPKLVNFGSNFFPDHLVVVNPLPSSIEYFKGVLDAGSIKLFPLGSNLAFETLAAAGSITTDATQIRGRTIYVTAANGTKGVKLPSVKDNVMLTITNATASVGLKIWPAAGEKINGGTADAAAVITSAATDTSSAMLYKKAAGDWYLIMIRGTLS